METPSCEIIGGASTTLWVKGQIDRWRRLFMIVYRSYIEFFFFFSVTLYRLWDYESMCLWHLDLCTWVFYFLFQVTVLCTGSDKMCFNVLRMCVYACQCVCVCVSVCVCVCECACQCVCVCVWMCMCVFIIAFTCMCASRSCVLQNVKCTSFVPAKYDTLYHVFVSRMQKMQ